MYRYHHYQRLRLDFHHLLRIPPFASIQVNVMFNFIWKLFSKKKKKLHMKTKHLTFSFRLLLFYFLFFYYIIYYITHYLSSIFISFLTWVKLECQIKHYIELNFTFQKIMWIYALCVLNFRTQFLLTLKLT